MIAISNILVNICVNYEHLLFNAYSIIFMILATKKWLMKYCPLAVTYLRVKPNNALPKNAQFLVLVPHFSGFG